MKTKFYKSQVIENQKLNYKFRHLRFKLKDKGFSFKAGQFLIIKISESVFRPYSIASIPKNLPYWELLIDISPAGPGSQFLKKLKPGEIVETSSAKGNLTLKDDKSNNLIFVATGCGLASIKPIIEELLNRKSQKKIYLFWGLRYQKDIFYQKLLEKWKKEQSNFHYEIILSQPENGWPGKKGHVNKHALKLIKNLPLTKTSCYLCGNQKMIEELRLGLMRIGFPENKIYFEKYF